MKFIEVRKAMQEAIRNIRTNDTRRNTLLGEKILAMFGNDVKANDMLGDMINACHAVNTNVFTTKTTAKALVFVILSGLKKREELNYCSTPINEAMDSLKVGDKEWKLLSDTIDYINGKDTDSALIKCAAIFYKVAKEG